MTLLPNRSIANIMKVIEKTAGLEAACASLRQASYVTLDTEFLRTNTYWPILCLIQIAGPNEAYIIDPMAEGLSLAPFTDLMADESVLKVLHAARQDMEIFLHDFGALPRPVFDTQIAAMVCGFGDSVGYETLVNQIAKTSIDKSSRFTDWSRRPLSKKQLTYAIGDVTHLRVIYENLAEKLEANSRIEWLSEEMDDLTNPATYVVEPGQAWQRLKVRSKNRRFIAIVQAVAAWREQRAQETDVPRNRVVRDDVLMEIAAHPPKSPDDLRRIRGVSDGFAKGHGGETLLAAVSAALDMPDAALPKPAETKRLPRGIGPTVDLLKVLLKMRCEEAEVAQKLVANVADLEQLAADDHANIPASQGWRRDIFGADALALKQGKLGLSIKNGRVVVTET